MLRVDYKIDTGYDYYRHTCIINADSLTEYEAKEIIYNDIESVRGLGEKFIDDITITDIKTDNNIVIYNSIHSKTGKCF